MKSKSNILQTKVGVLGGGQLGKMLALAAGNWHLPLYFLDESRDFPAGAFAAGFKEGSFKDYDAVYNIGKEVDVLTIEIEHVNTDALLQLAEEGLTIHPKPSALNIIKDKGLQKQFYQQHQLPTADFQLFENEAELLQAIEKQQVTFPFVQKSRTAGYDGKGVAVLRSPEDLATKLLPGACVIEQLVDIQKELAVIVARNEAGEIVAFPTVEMEFNPEANLVEFLVSPAQIDPAIEAAAEQLAQSVIEAFDICGLLAVELFLTNDNQLLINEVAPRPHNSGHPTIDNCYTSQFEQHLRGILNLPLGSTKLKSPAVMVNLLGEPGYSGNVFYQGLNECLAIEGVNIHLYGKAITKPFRKMGHVTILGDTVEAAKEKARRVQKILKVISAE
ncbi:MAG: 5-(carboxyamino)imidazole ribonucleotide synthase [Saprospiraceae bacterium]